MDEITQNNDDVEEICRLVRKSVKRILSEGNPMLRHVVVYSHHDHAEEDFRGVFHAWGNTHAGVKGQFVNVLAGIIEDDNGYVHIVWPELIKFVVKGEE